MQKWSKKKFPFSGLNTNVQTPDSSSKAGSMEIRNNLISKKTFNLKFQSFHSFLNIFTVFSVYYSSSGLGFW